MRHCFPVSTVLTSLAILACIGYALPADATDIPLPALTGGYEFSSALPPDAGAPPIRSIDFVLPDNVSAIEQLSLVISGQWRAGESTCDIDDPFTSPLLPPLSLVITSAAFPGDFFMATSVVPDGPFTDLTAEVTSCCPPGVLNFDQLVGADLHAELSIGLAFVGMCWLSVDTYGTLDEVRLELTGTVPAVDSSWGSVKTLYR